MPLLALPLTDSHIPQARPTLHFHPFASRAGKRPKDRFNYNPEIFFDEAPHPERAAYTRVTSNDLKRHANPPARVKVLGRDFIEDSLYNPQYGYFPRQATIFTFAGDPIHFRACTTWQSLRL
jgi:hypothetical protein